jgi:hypothetical protein
MQMYYTCLFLLPYADPIKRSATATPVQTTLLSNTFSLNFRTAYNTGHCSPNDGTHTTDCTSEPIRSRFQSSSRSTVELNMWIDPQSI